VRITSVKRSSSPKESEEEKVSRRTPEKKSTIKFGGYDEATIPQQKKRHSFSHCRILEPEGKAEQKGGHIIIQVNLPGVKEGDIDIQKLEESIEIKAFKENEAYFKQIQVPQSSEILSHHLEGDELIIEMG
jgi:HSP20 family molecular chaperone IbpA